MANNGRVSDWPRHGVQAGWTLLTNSFFAGYSSGKIYKGSLKNICVPGLNCYSCPGAVGSCPIGSIQAVIGSANYKVAFYVFGFLFFIGALLGRFVCGWLCPFGLLQDLLHKIPFFKKISTFRGDKILRWFKYVVLLVFVILLPMFLVDILGQGAPYFCKLICPVGTLEGGVPLVILNKAVHGTIGFLFKWKLGILIVTVLLSIVVYRPFCKYVCPLGAIYSIFNPISIYSLSVDKSACFYCSTCRNVCKMQVNPLENPNSTECIRCGKCVQTCPSGAIRAGFFMKSRIEKSSQY